MDTQVLDDDRLVSSRQATNDFQQAAKVLSSGLAGSANLESIPLKKANISASPCPVEQLPMSRIDHLSTALPHNADSSDMPPSCRAVYTRCKHIVTKIVES
jgi:hypothetical protein